MLCKWNNMKISNRKNLLKDFSTIFHFTNNNISLISCNAHKDKLIWKYIHLPKSWFDCTFLLTYFSRTHYFQKSDFNIYNFAVLYMNLHCPYLFYFLRTLRPNWLLLSQKELLIFSITNASLNLHWLATIKGTLMQILKIHHMLDFI